MEKVKHLALHASCISSLRNQANQLQLLTQETLQNCRNFSIFAQKGKGKNLSRSIHHIQCHHRPLKIPSIHEEAIGGRSDGTSTHGALAKLLATMTISANHMATWNQNDNRPMLVTNGTSGTGASSGLGRGFCASGIFRSPLHSNLHSNHEIVAAKTWPVHLSLWKAQLHEKFLQRLFQHVLTHASAPQVPGHFNYHGAGALCNLQVAPAMPPIRSSFACLDEPWFSLSPPCLEHLLRLGLIGLLGVDHVHCQLLTERQKRGGSESEGWRSNHKRCVTAGGQKLRKKRLLRDDRKK